MRAEIAVCRSTSRGQPRSTASWASSCLSRQVSSGAANHSSRSGHRLPHAALPHGRGVGPADGLQRARLVQVHDALGAGLAPRAPRVVIALADCHSASAVGDVLQVQREHLAWAQPAVQHQHRQVP